VVLAVGTSVSFIVVGLEPILSSITMLGDEGELSVAAPSRIWVVVVNLLMWTSLLWYLLSVRRHFFDRRGQDDGHG
jgi:hypothetical protein